MRAFVTIFILLILVSCSGGRPTKANINVVGMTVTSSSGGLVIYGYNTLGDKFTRVLNTGSATGTISEDIPQGTWSFGAVSWSNPAIPFGGVIKCAFTNNVVMSTDSAAVNLKVTNENCFSATVALPSTYTGPIGAQVFKTIKSNFCESDVSTRTNVPCSYGVSTRPIQRGMVGSYKLFVPGGRTYNKVSTVLSGEYLESKCYNANNDANPPTMASYTLTEMNVPAFNPSVKFPLQVLAHLGMECETSKGILVRDLTDPVQAKIHVDTGLNFLHVSTPMATLCSLSIDNTAPASGNGTLNSPWLICTEEQLLKLQKNYAGNFKWQPTKAGIYVLGRDMNLIKFIKGPSTGTPSDTCLQDGETFVPIGKYFSGCGSLLATSPDANFKFDGNGHTIHHFRFHRSGESNIGFFSNVSGDVYDVNFDRALVEGIMNTGVVAGTKSGGTLKMIKVLNSRVEGGDYTGGIVGLDGSTSSYMLFGERLDIEGQNRTGGLLGSSAAPLNDATFDGTIYVESGYSNVGGIVGFTTAGPMARVGTKGVISSGGMNVGGIAGTAALINHARSEMLLKDMNPSLSGMRNFGGIVGDQTGNATSKSYFNGFIDSRCNGPGCTIAGISGAGNAPTDTFSTYSNTSRGGQNGTAKTVAAVYGGSFYVSMCNGSPTCKWVQAPGSKPRFSTFENTTDVPACAKLPASLPLTNQALTPYFRGTSDSPFIICTPAQFAEIENFDDAYYIVADHINLADYSTGSLTSLNNETIDGLGNILFGFHDTTTDGDMGLFDSIDSYSVIKNLKLAGFRLDPPACTSGCKIGTLARYNSGTISNVEVDNAWIDLPFTNTRAGGLVTQNNGTIANVRVSVDLLSYKYAGGIAGDNPGTITKSSSFARITANNDATDSQFYGGIAASSTGIISKSRFRGEIRDISDSSKVGGIAGEAVAGSLVDNEFAKDGRIETGANTFQVGGLVGIDSASLSLTRNLSRGTFIGTIHSPDLLSLSGTALANMSGNYKMTVPQVLYQSSLSASGHTFNPGDKSCRFNLSVGAGDGSGLVSGMVANGSTFYHGDLTDNTTSYIFVTKTWDSSECSAITSGLQVYKGQETADSYSVSTLKNTGFFWDIADMTVPAEADVVFAAYVKVLKGLDPGTTSTWINDNNEEGLNLFMVND